MQALVRVDADDPGGGQLERPPPLEPLIDQIVGEALAHRKRGHLVQPRLAHIEQEKRSGNDQKDLQLPQEFRHITPLDGIVEGHVPFVEDNLRIGGQENDGQKRNALHHHPSAHFRLPEGVCHDAELTAQRQLEADADILRRTTPFAVLLDRHASSTSALRFFCLGGKSARSIFSNGLAWHRPTGQGPRTMRRDTLPRMIVFVDRYA